MIIRIHITSNNNNIIDFSSGNRFITKNDGTAIVTVSFPEGSGRYYVQTLIYDQDRILRFDDSESRRGAWDYYLSL